MPSNDKRTRKRGRELGIVNGILTPGVYNAITFFPAYFNILHDTVGSLFLSNKVR